MAIDAQGGREGEGGREGGREGVSEREGGREGGRRGWGGRGRFKDKNCNHQRTLL